MSAQFISECDQLMKEWDYTSNLGLDPTKLTSGCNKKVFWVCYLCGHKWQTTIYHRAQNGRSCPKCHHGRWLKGKKSLLETHPELAKNWHPTKNNNLTPNLFTKSSRYKVFWKCSQCGKETYKSIKEYNGCIECKQMQILRKRSLAITHPHLKEEWDYNKNIYLPEHFLAGNDSKVWWKCRKCSYEWQARINNRAILNRGCPYCGNKVVIEGKNDLATTHPQLAKEWHPTKNGKLTPQQISAGGNKKVWWLCPQGHEYKATPGHRTCEKGTNCPVCVSGRQTSFAEQAFYFYTKKAYPYTINRYKDKFLGRLELDIYVPSIKLAVEYDGEAFHKSDKLAREIKKYELCQKHNITLIRFREKEPLTNKPIADKVYCLKDLYLHKNLEKMIIKFFNDFNFPTVDVNINRDKNFILQNYATEYKQGSFGELYPKIAQEWHPQKNEKLTPFMFKPNSDHKVWWKCPKCHHEYQATIGSKTRGNGCKKCFSARLNKTKMKRVAMINYETGDIIKIFPSITEAGKKMNINSSNISMVCKNERPKAGGYSWKYVDELKSLSYPRKAQQLSFNF